MPRHATKLKLIATVVSGAFLIGGLAACGRTQSTESLLTDAKQYQQKGDLKAALIQLKNAVEKSPDNGDARMQLAALQLKMGDMASAEKEARKARSLGIAADVALPVEGKAMAQQGRFKEMLETITPELAARSAPLLSLRGDSLMATGKADDAKQAYEQALAVNPNAGDALLGLARHAMAANDRDAAERYSADAVAKDAEQSGSLDVPRRHAALQRQAGRRPGRLRQGAGAGAEAPQRPRRKSLYPDQPRQIPRSENGDRRRRQGYPEQPAGHLYARPVRILAR